VTGTDYLVLQSGSPIIGQFADSKVVSGSVQGTLDYTKNPDDVYLDVGFGTLLPLLPPNPPQNVINVADAIDNYILGGGTLPAGFQNLFNYSPAQLENALAQLAGQAATGAATSSFQLMTDFLNLLFDPTMGGSGAPPGAPTAFAPEDEALPPDVAAAYDSALDKPPPQLADFAQRWSAWGSGFGGYNTTQGNAATGAANVTATDYGFAGGMDYHASPDLKLGFALAGAGTNWSLAQSLGSGRSDSFQVGGYGTLRFGAAYLSGAVAFANHWFTTNRIAVGDQLTANFTGQSAAGRFEGGYRFAVDPLLGLTPYAAVQAQYFRTPSYSETDLSGGGFGLSYSAMSATDTRGELGMRLDNLNMIGDMPLILRARLGWAHDWINDPALGAAFNALPGSSFTVNGAAPPTNSGLVSGAAELRMTANWSLTAKFDGELAQTAQTYAGSGTLKYSW
jgi:uncharacterized protein with beta-barrel porin domain